MAFRFEQFLNARSAYGPTVDVSGHRLYFMADVTGVSALWSLALGEDGAWPEPLVTSLDRVQAAHPSPTPGRLIVAADVGGAERTQLFLIDGPGTSPRRLTDDPDVIHHFGGWHPDGQTISLASNRRNPHYFDVELLNVSTGERRTLWQTDATSNAGLFSPDGTMLLVWREDTPSDQTVFVVDVRSGSVTRLTPGGTPAIYESLCWSRDSSCDYVITDVGREYHALVTIDVATGQMLPLVSPACDVDAFSLSPDGQQLIYTLNRGGVSELRLRETDDGGDRRVHLPPGQVHDGMR